MNISQTFAKFRGLDEQPSSEDSFNQLSLELDRLKRQLASELDKAFPQNGFRLSITTMNVAPILILLDPNQTDPPLTFDDFDERRLGKLLELLKEILRRINTITNTFSNKIQDTSLESFGDCINQIYSKVAYTYSVKSRAIEH